MDRRAFLRLLLAGTAGLLTACGGAGRNSETTTRPSSEPEPSAAPPTSASPASPSSSFPNASPPPSTVSLEAKIGQMLMVGFRGLAVDNSGTIGSSIQSGILGNVVLFDYDLPARSTVRNIQSREQLRALDSGLQALAAEPVLIAADQEGGQVARLRPQHGFPNTVSAQYLGQLNDLSVTEREAGIIAATLADVGINLNLAPVLDLNVNPSNPIIGSLGRSFGADLEIVAAHAAAFIDAHHARGVLCTLKHFPGHGSSKQDSHLGFVDVTQTWSRQELVPFQRLIRSGKVDAIMTAHIYNAGLDPDYPATLSEKTITGVLRGELGYDGVVITDDMQMGAIREYYGFEEAIELAVKAGGDIIAIANNTVYEPDVSQRAFQAIEGAVREGRISEAWIDQSYRRIRRLKQSLARLS